MKKTYEKPRLVALSLSGNDLLCASCMLDVVGPNAEASFKLTLEEAGITQPITENHFGSSTGGCQMEIPALEAYCKFNGTNTVINS